MVKFCCDPLQLKRKKSRTEVTVRDFLLLAAYRRRGVRRVRNRATLDCKAVFKVSEVSRLCSPTRVSEVSRLWYPRVSAFFACPRERALSTRFRRRTR